MTESLEENLLQQAEEFRRLKAVYDKLLDQVSSFDLLITGMIRKQLKENERIEMDYEEKGHDYKLKAQLKTLKRTLDDLRDLKKRADKVKGRFRDAEKTLGSIEKEIEEQRANSNLYFVHFENPSKRQGHAKRLIRNCNSRIKLWKRFDSTDRDAQEEWKSVVADLKKVNEDLSEDIKEAVEEKLAA